MLKLFPILLALIYGYVMIKFSAARGAKQLDQNSTELTDPILLAQMMRLANALDLPSIKVYLYEIEQVNGLAAPDGRIFITRGFYEKFRRGEVSAEEMASVVAHELGHVALGHSKRRMIDFSGQNALRTALAMVVSRFIPFVGPIIAGALTNMLASKLSRVDEYEADAYASALLHKSGIGTDAQKSLFTKLNALTGAHGAQTPAWFMSHPKVAERITAIEENEMKWRVQ